MKKDLCEFRVFSSPELTFRLILALLKGVADGTVLSLILCCTLLLVLFFFWQHCMTCEILVPWPGTEPRPLAVRVWSPNHWAAREFPH